MTAATNPSGASASRNPRPSAIDLDRQIDARLAAFDATPRPVRDAAWTIASMTMRMSSAEALRVLAFARRVLGRGRP